MCENIDWNVGRVLAKLDELRLADNTIVLYFSDNGPNSWRWNGGMKGRKGSTDEGGVRAPLLIRWPGHIPAGTTHPADRRRHRPAAHTGRAGRRAAGAKHTSRSTARASCRCSLGDGAADWPDRMIFSHWSGKVSVRTQQYRLDNAGKLFDMTADPGQTAMFRSKNPRLPPGFCVRWPSGSATCWPSCRAKTGRFTVGYREFPDDRAAGARRRAARQYPAQRRAPNCSFLTNWTSADDSITWDVDVHTPGKYAAVVHYTCPEADVGSQIELSLGTGRAQATVTQAHDPPLVGAAQDRVPRDHESYVKDFAPLSLGTLELPAGRHELTLRALSMPGQQVMDVRAVTLKLVD